MLTQFSFAQTDSLQELSIDQFLTIVKTNHPISKQADLVLKSGEAQLLRARGGFDPKIEGRILQKYFQEELYYNMVNGELSMPTPVGIDIKGGYDLNTGTYLNPENTNPTTGIFYTGVSVPLSRGLIIDKRRAELKKAKIYNEATVFQKQLLMNDLILEAGIVFWNWYEAYQELNISTEALSIAQDRFNAVKQSSLIGESPFIDTVEAKIQVQSRDITFSESKINFQNATLLMSVFLWSEDGVPLTIKENTIPEQIDSPDQKNIGKEIYQKIDSLNFIHPELKLYENKISSLQVDKKWFKEQLKPRINLDYFPLTEGFANQFSRNFSLNNYKWGIDLSFPLFLRKERANVKMAKLNIWDAEFKYANKQELLNAKVNSELNSWQNNAELFFKSEKMMQDSKQLLDAERTLFNAGESSLFLINSREINYIKTQNTRIKYLTKNKISELKTLHALGILNN